MISTCTRAWQREGRKKGRNLLWLCFAHGKGEERGVIIRKKVTVCSASTTLATKEKRGGGKSPIFLSIVIHV